MGATSGETNWHSISSMGRDFLKCCNQRLPVKCLSTTTSQNTLLHGLSHFHGLRRLTAVTWSHIRWATAPFWCYLLIFIIICEIKMTVSWTILMNCLNTLSILQRCEDTLDAKGTQFAIYAKLCMETAQEQISFAVHQNLCKFLNIYFFLSMTITNIILSVKGQSYGNKWETENLANSFF